MYGLILWLRNCFFDWGVIREGKVKARVISVGNLSLGGTGKSPHVEWIADHLSDKFNLAILSRGYGRKSKGYVRVTKSVRSSIVGDEALFYKKRFGDHVVVAVCEKRLEGAETLIHQHPNINCIVLDDAYQHRYIHRDVNILLTTYDHPFYHDFVVPVGRLREFRSGKNRADIVIVSKCPDQLTDIKKSEFIDRMKLNKSVEVFFSKIVYGCIRSFEGLEIINLPSRIILVTGIANPDQLIKHIENIAEVTHFSFSDHHDFTHNDIKRIHNKFDTFADQNACIITTSKDFVRLKNSALSEMIREYPWYYQEIKVEIDREDEFLKQLE